MSDPHEDIAVKLAMVLRALHGTVPGLVDLACEEYGVEIDWAHTSDEDVLRHVDELERSYQQWNAPSNQEEGETVIGPG